VKTEGAATVARMRPGALAVVAIVAAALGAAAVLVVGTLAGWTGIGEGATTVVVPTASEPEAEPAARPLVGQDFDAARIYAERAPGVVTLYATFAGGQRSQGSGFVVSDQGHILTNSHVVTTANGRDTGRVRGAEQVYVVFSDGDRIPGSIVGWDLFNDVGLVKVDPKDHPVSPLPLGDSSKVVVGEPVAAVGSPFDQAGSLSVGVISAVNRSIPSLTSAYDVADAIQIDAPINQGNSGGPLLDARGRVIGINAQIRSDSGTAEGVGFAIPINSARRSMEQLISEGRVAYAYVGVSTQDVTPALARELGLRAERGALIQSVVDDAPAARAGLRGATERRVVNGVPISVGGDLIVRFAGRPVERAADIASIVTESLRPGQTVPVTVLRGDNGRRQTLRLRLGERPLEPTR
jgi:S1-C subfamily serine protease